MTSLRIAACHLSPIILSARSTTEKCISAITKAASNGANVVVFPETFIPAFPVWSALRAPTDNHDFFKRMAAESILADGTHIRAVRDAAKQNGVVVSLGISERVSYSAANLYNSNLIIGTEGEVHVHHRKLMPTFFEKLTWSPGDGAGLRVAETPFGRIGALICGENTNPLARYALMAQGEQVHISTWPAAWPTRVPQGKHSSDDGDGTGTSHGIRTKGSSGKNYDNVAANRTRAAAHCFEAKCFGVVCAGFLDQPAIEEIASSSTDADFVRRALENSPRAATMFLDPTGTAKHGYTIDDNGKQEDREFLQETEGILYADLDLDETVEGKQYHDVVGGYQRFDVFELKVDRSRRSPVIFNSDDK